MPATVTVPMLIASFVVLLLLMAVVGAWIWVILRLALGMPVLPPDTPRVVPWGAGSVLAVMLVWLFLMATAPNIYNLSIRKAPAVSLEDFSPGEKMTLSAAENVATLALIPLLLALTCGARLRDLGLVARGFLGQVARGLVAYPLLAPVVFGVMYAATRALGKTNHPLQDAIFRDPSPAMVVILTLAGVVLAPAAEELIFRGVLLGWLTRIALGVRKPTGRDSAIGGFDESFPPVDEAQLIETVEIETLGGAHEADTQDTAEQAIPGHYAPPGVASASTAFEPSAIGEGSRAVPLLAANVAVSLVFATLHGAVWPTPIPLFFLSLGLGFLYQRTGGIVAPIALHMVFNGVSTLMMFLTVGVAPKPDPKVPVPPPVHRVENPAKGPLTASVGFDTVSFPNDADDVRCSIGAGLPPLSGSATIPPSGPRITSTRGGKLPISGGHDLDRPGSGSS